MRRQLSGLAVVIAISTAVMGCQGAAVVSSAPTSPSSAGGEAMPPEPSPAGTPAAAAGNGEPTGKGPSVTKTAGSVTFTVVSYTDKYTDIDRERQLTVDLCSSSQSATQWTPLGPGHITLLSTDGRKLTVKSVSGYFSNFPRVSDNLIKNLGAVQINPGCTGQQRWELSFDDPNGAQEPKLGSVSFTSDQEVSVSFTASEIPSFVLLPK